MRSWLLVEQPGPWGRDAATESQLRTTVGRDLLGRARAAGVRVVIIRRAGRTAPVVRRSWAFVDSRPGAEGAWWGTFDEDDELLSVPLERGAVGDASVEPIYLVCTHGRHDTCCAMRGRPVAAALAVHHPERTWECSHVGGDRFAANIVMLPHGLYYGHVNPDGALDAATAYDEGRIVPAVYRGRSSLPAPVQAAQHYARVALGDDSIDAYPPRSVQALGGGLSRVRLGRADGTVTVAVQEGPAGEPTRLTCSATTLARPRGYALVSLDRP